MVADAIEHVAGLEIPHNHRTHRHETPLLTCGQKCARFGDSDLADAPLVPFQIRIHFLLDALDHYCAANSPNKVHVRGMDHHAIPIRRIETNRGTYAEMLSWGHLLDHF